MEQPRVPREGHGYRPPVKEIDGQRVLRDAHVLHFLSIGSFTSERRHLS